MTMFGVRQARYDPVPAAHKTVLLILGPADEPSKPRGECILVHASLGKVEEVQRRVCYAHRYYSEKKKNKMAGKMCLTFFKPLPQRRNLKRMIFLRSKCTLRNWL